MIENIYGRPHTVLYDVNTNLFYALASQNKIIYCYKNVNNKLVLQYDISLDFLTGMYVRNIQIINAYMYFATANGYIFKSDYLNNYAVIASYVLPSEMVATNGINKIDNYFYVSFQGRYMIRIQNLNDISISSENLYYIHGLQNTAYFISHFDNKIYYTEIGNEQNSIIEVNPDNVNDFKILYRFYSITENDTKRLSMYPT